MSTQVLNKLEDEVEQPPPDLGSYRSLLRLAGPLILSLCGQQIMHLLDGLMLSHYSAEAIAAQGPSSMLAWTLCSLFIGAAGYSSTFVAQYEGAGQHDRIAGIVWQAVYFGLGAGLVLAMLGWPLGLVFAAIGHEPRLAAAECLFMRIASLGAPTTILGSDLSGFFSGRGDTGTLMKAQIAAQIVNAVSAWLLIFGIGPVPELGLAGAAWAGNLAQLALCLVLFPLFLRRRHRRVLGTWRHRAFDRDSMARLLRYGLPNGARITVEMVGWTGFLLIVGRLGETDLAATNIVWRINSLVLFPLWGVTQAVSIVVGQAQGLRRPDLTARVTWRGMLVAELGMLACGVLFLAMPRPLLHIFLSESAHVAGSDQLVEIGVILLRYVATYCLVDGVNLTLMSVLNGVGDTRATLAINLVLFSLFLVAMLVLERTGAGLYAYWLAITIQVGLMASALLARFLSGRWREMTVISEPAQEAA